MNINNMTYDDLEQLKEMIAARQEYLKTLAENFLYNEFKDDYIYITYFEDGSYYYDMTGASAYKRYKNNPGAVKICRKTKDLKPKYQTILEKGNYHA